MTGMGFDCWADEGDPTSVSSSWVIWGEDDFVTYSDLSPGPFCSCVVTRWFSIERRYRKSPTSWLLVGLGAKKTRKSTDQKNMLLNKKQLSTLTHCEAHRKRDAAGALFWKPAPEMIFQKTLSKFTWHLKCNFIFIKILMIFCWFYDRLYIYLQSNLLYLSSVNLWHC